MPICTNCNVIVGEDDTFCKKCGSELKSKPSSAETTENKLWEQPKKRTLYTWVSIGFAICIALVIGLFVLQDNGNLNLSCNSSNTNQTFVIKVSGTTGTTFSGSYFVVQSNGTNASKSVTGKVPTNYTVNGNIVSVVFQKTGVSGTLTVTIHKNDVVLVTSTTTSSYGLVTLATGN